MGVIEKASTTPVPPELLKGVVQMIGELPPEERSDFTGRALAVIRFLENERPELKGTADRPLLLVAIQFRLEALSRLHKRSEYKAWSIKAEKRENPDLIQGVLIEAAATEPLIERNEHAAFEPKRFFQTVLRLSEAAGQA